MRVPGTRTKKIIGNRYGRLTVISFAHNGSKKKKAAHWLCKCDCGKEKIIRGNRLQEGRVKSCGCIKMKHNLAESRVYKIWKCMKQRCLNPNNLSYKNYGSRGIKLCERWIDFKNFFTDMGEPPTPKHTLERVNNDGNYEPSNCKWIPKGEQQNNTRKNIYLIVNNERKSLSELCKQYQMVRSTLYKRIFINKWDVIKALTTPPIKPIKRN